MAAQERLGVLFVWTGIVVFSALWFLGSGLLKASIITFFILVSCAVGLGRRRLLQASFAISIVAIAVSLGFPHPNEWLPLAKSMWTAIDAGRLAAMR